MNWDDVRLFLTVAEQGSLRRAAAKLEVGHSTLSRRIEALETSIDAKLFSRQSTGLTLTAAGEEMLRTAATVSEQLDGLASRLFGRDSDISGHIRVTMPDVIFEYLLADPLSAFMTQWPDITLEIDCSYQLMNLATREADLAIRVTNTPSDSLIGSRVGTLSDAAYATESYLARFNSMEERRHQVIHPGGDYPRDFVFLPEYESAAPSQIRLTLPGIRGQTRAAELSLGVAMLPTIIGEQHPQLIRLSEPSLRSEIWMLGHADTRQNPRLQLFRAFLREVFAANRLVSADS